jgi:cytochrome P450/NADPH-cytochrome P450 reductase
MSDTTSTNMEGTVEIPSPPGLPFLGNIKNINPELPLESFMDMAETYGEFVACILHD